MPKFKEIVKPQPKTQELIDSTAIESFNVISPNFALGAVAGRPNFGNPIATNLLQPVFRRPDLPPIEIPSANAPRAINYYADYAGCGWWRMIAPELLLNINQKAVITGFTCMITDSRFYKSGISSIRLQRQATPHQLEFFNALHRFSDECEKTTGRGFRMIYEIDDIIFKDDIPDYNRCKIAFEDSVITKSIAEMMKSCDEITVTCEFMKNYYIAKTGNKNVTILPNYPARMWMDNHYDLNRLMSLHEKNKKQPRVGVVMSGTHIDISNKTNQKDDYTHVVSSIVRARKDYKFVFVGAFPLPLKPFIDSGEMEYIPWFPLLDFWKAYVTTDLSMTFAALENNTFNKAKSNIKFLESACFGIPCACQDLVTYKDAIVKFNSGDELIDRVKETLKDASTYKTICEKSRAYANNMFLDDHLDEFEAIYFTKFGSKERNEKSPRLILNNPDQKI